MINSSNDRIAQIEILLERFIDAGVLEHQASNERMTRLEQTMERQNQESNERMTRVEEGLERVEQVVESNNKFLQAFSADLKCYMDRLDNFTARIDGVIATSNQDRQEINRRLNAIQNQVTKGNQPQL